MVGISQSGESTDTNAVLEDARLRGAVTVGITNRSDSAMARIAQYVIAGARRRRGERSRNKDLHLPTPGALSACAAMGGQVDVEILRRLPDWVDAGSRTGGTRGRDRRALYIHDARGHGRPRAELRQCAGVRAQANGDLLRGGRAFFVGRPDARPDRANGARSFPVFAFAPPGVTWPSISAMLDQLEELKAETLIISDESNPEATAKPARLIQLPIHSLAPAGPCDLYTPIPYIVPAQLFAAHLAAIKGLNPDRPRTLHKVTRTI